MKRKIEKPEDIRVNGKKVKKLVKKVTVSPDENWQKIIRDKRRENK